MIYVGVCVCLFEWGEIAILELCTYAPVINEVSSFVRSKILSIAESNQGVYFHSKYKINCQTKKSKTQADSQP